jgi:16S rRNA (guanine527-N7)-methyltransferase
MNLDTDAMRSTLRDGALALTLDLPESVLDKLLDYLALLYKWNAVYNLTAVRDPQQMMTQHLLDCMAALPAFAGARRVLDVGAGGGLPGMVIAVWAQHAKPDMRVELIDTVQKKTAFLTQVKAELGLANVTVHTGRVETLQVKESFDVITSRAFAQLSDFINWSGHLLQKGGRMIALKGQAKQTEKESAPEGWEILEIQSLRIPGLEAERHLVWAARIDNKQHTRQDQ